MPSKKEVILDRALQILEHAGCVQHDRIFHTSGFAPRDISIDAQRRRALNLAWALHHADLVKDGSVVGVIGAGFSGLAIAVALALLRNCIILLIERESSPLSLHKRSMYRYVSPELNTAATVGAEEGRASDGIRLFSWKAGSAADAASKWQEEFEYYAAALPIFLYDRTECARIRKSKGSKSRPLMLELKTVEPVGCWKAPVDIAVLATGFGNEANPLEIPDHSYWASGSPLLYEPNKRKESVLVCGGGDSGVIEVLHYVLKDFSHDRVSTLVKSVSPSLARHIESALEHGDYNSMTTSNREWAFDQPRVRRPILSWYCSVKSLHLLNPDKAAELKHGLGPARPVFVRLEALLRECGIPTGKATTWEQFHRRWQAIASIDEKTCQMFDQRLAGPMAKLLASELESVLTPPLQSVFNLGAVKMACRSDFNVTWSLSTASPFSASLSNVNLLLAWLLVKSGKVRLFPKRAAKAVRNSSGWLVTFEDGKRVEFDRVATRLGPDRHTLQSRYRSRAKTTDEEVLLYPWISMIGVKGSRVTYVQPAATDINRAIASVREDLILQDRQTGRATGIQPQKVFRSWPAHRIVEDGESVYRELFSLRRKHGAWDFMKFSREWDKAKHA